MKLQRWCLVLVCTIGCWVLGTVFLLWHAPAHHSQRQLVANAPTTTNSTIQTFSGFNRRVHVFFYSWYANPQFDGVWKHWNHEILQHWVPHIAKDYPHGSYAPPVSHGSSYLPKFGLYSSYDPQVMTLQFRQLRDYGIHVVSVSWWGPKFRPQSRDRQGSCSDETIPLILEVAARCGLLVNFHLEPYEGRSAASTREDIEYIVKTYGDHAAFYRDPERNNKPLYYLYDSYIIPSYEWKKVFSPQGEMSVRGTSLDGDFIGLILTKTDIGEISSGEFDGFYTYFASNGFTQAATWSSWKSLAQTAKERNLIFIPSVGPGYDDTKVRPWNQQNTKDRKNGDYYRESWRSALDTSPYIVSVTSYNEWHEGTQIEPAVPFQSESAESGKDYSPNSPEFYLELTSQFIGTLANP